MDRHNLALSLLAGVIIWALFIAAIMHYNATERDRSVACSEAGGTYAEGRCDVR